MLASRRSLSNQRGFTLVELLVAMTVTLMVIGGAFTAFQHGLRANEVATLSLDTNGSLRGAMDLIVRDFNQVGQGLPSGKTIPLPSGAGATAIIRPGPPGAGLTFPYPATQTVLSAVTPGEGFGPVAPGTTAATDVITIVYVDSLFRPVTCALAADGSSTTVSNPPAPDPANPTIERGDLIMFTNSLGAAMQMVTARVGYPAQTVSFGMGDPLNLNQRGAAAGTILDLQSSAGIYPATTASRVRMVTYYIETRNAVPQLIRCINAECVVDPTGRRTVAIGIENFQISYDLVDGVGNPANVRLTAGDLAGGTTDCASPCSPNQVRKVNVFLAARSRRTSALTNQFVRNSLATQVSLRSLALVDRYR